jgi:chromate reductase
MNIENDSQTGAVRVLGIAGSLRRASMNRALLHAAIRLAPPALEIREFEGLGEIPLYNADIDTDEQRPEIVAGLKTQIAAADAVLLVTPEYNWGVPGVLKNALDWASRPGFKSVLAGKPAGMMGASGGPLGTARAQTQLRQTLDAVLARVLPHPGVLVGRAQDKFEDGELVDEPTRKFIRGYLEALAEWARLAGTQGKTGRG